MSAHSLQIYLSRLKPLDRKKVVFTNGCFDILHPGHTDYLDRARRLGITLIVALNSDESVSKLKGPSRPINPLQDRLRVVAALECVDYVTWFSEDTPLKIIQKLKPGILAKGGDWKAAQIVGSEETLALGGKVKSLKFIQGKSTTAIIQKLLTKSSIKKARH